MGVRTVRDQTSHRNAGASHGADEVAKNPVRRDHGLGRDGRPRTERSQAGRHEPTTNERRTADQSHWADPGMITVLTLSGRGVALPCRDRITRLWLDLFVRC